MSLKTTKLSSGAYTIRSADKAERLFFGSLFEAESMMAEGEEIFYLAEQASGGVDWEVVDFEHFRDYSGSQRKQLLVWLYEADCPMSDSGFDRLGIITGVPLHRIKSALRKPNEKNYRPVNEITLRFMLFNFTQWATKNDFGVPTKLVGKLEFIDQPKKTEIDS